MKVYIAIYVDWDATQIKAVFENEKDAWNWCKIESEKEAKDQPKLIENLPQGYKVRDVCFVFETFETTSQITP